jgi:hypothetical protein
MCVHNPAAPPLTPARAGWARAGWRGHTRHFRSGTRSLAIGWVGWTAALMRVRAPLHRRHAKQPWAGAQAIG